MSHIPDSDVSLLPVLIFAFSNESDSLHQLIPELVKHRLMKLQPRSAVKIEERKRRLQRRQQYTILRLHIITAVFVVKMNLDPCIMSFIILSMSK